MKIKFNKAYAGPFGAGNAGDIRNVEDHLASALIRNGDASEVKEIEAATAKPEENAKAATVKSPKKPQKKADPKPKDVKNKE